MTEQGVTPTEGVLNDLCNNSFFRLWSFANPFKDDAKEACDVIAIFGSHIFIFFDRSKTLPDLRSNEKPQVVWDRWKRSVIDAQIRTADGAERYIKSGRPLFTDQSLAKPLPAKIDLKNCQIHKIIIANGAEEACISFSEENVSGSLAISYNDELSTLNIPFFIQMRRSNPIHILDSHSLPLLMRHLDTVGDMVDYFTAKESAISRYRMLTYCGEEDLLSNYYRNIDKRTNSHFIGTAKKNVTAFIIAEGDWADFCTRAEYLEAQLANEDSYIWDELIKKTSSHWKAGTLVGSVDLINDESAILEMASERRFHRRIYSKAILDSIEQFPVPTDQPIRQLRIMQSIDPAKAYVFLQVWVPPKSPFDTEAHQVVRQEALRVACGVVKNRFPELNKIVGIGVDCPKWQKANRGEDLGYLNCAMWSDQQRSEIETSNEAWGFLTTENVRIGGVATQEFGVSSKLWTSGGVGKVGRNERCPCGSGRKFKYCHYTDKK